MRGEAPPDDRDTLQRWLRRPTTPSGLTRRARILLALNRGRSATDTARLLHISRATVHLWHLSYRAQGLGGLVDWPRSGRPSVLDRRTAERILLLTTERVPMETPIGSTRLMARYAGVTQWQVRQVWQAAYVKPHRLKTTLSRRSQHLRGRSRPVPSGEGLHLVLDSTGLSIVGAGEWAAAAGVAGGNSTLASISPA